MLKRGILNSDIRKMTAELGHRDLLAITDAGYNIAKGIQRADLAFLPGIPDILPVLEGIVEEIYVEKIIMAEEIKAWAPQLHQEYLKRIPKKCEIVYIAHSEFDEMMKGVEGVIRTGQYGLHAPNLILQAGCAYDE